MKAPVSRNWIFTPHETNCLPSVSSVCTPPTCECNKLVPRCQGLRTLGFRDTMQGLPRLWVSGRGCRDCTHCGGSGTTDIVGFRDTVQGLRALWVSGTRCRDYGHCGFQGHDAGTTGIVGFRDTMQGLRALWVSGTRC
jgi:hypothetical protein